MFWCDVYLPKHWEHKAQNIPYCGQETSATQYSTIIKLLLGQSEHCVRIPIKSSESRATIACLYAHQTIFHNESSDKEVIKGPL